MESFQEITLETAAAAEKTNSSLEEFTECLQDLSLLEKTRVRRKRYPKKKKKSLRKIARLSRRKNR